MTDTEPLTRLRRVSYAEVRRTLAARGWWGGWVAGHLISPQNVRQHGERVHFHSMHTLDDVRQRVCTDPDSGWRMAYYVEVQP